VIDLYRMYDRRRSLLYVGISTNAATRATQHATDKPWWPEVDYIHVEHLNCDRQTALTIERRTIREEKPRYNVIHNIPDEYEPTVQVRPFTVEREMARKPQFRKMAYAVNTFAGYMQALGVERAEAIRIVEHLYRCAEVVRDHHDCRTEMFPVGVHVTTDLEGEQHADVMLLCPNCQTYDLRPAPRKD
jgi:excinuclease UvrABC nuclease subunit